MLLPPILLALSLCSPALQEASTSELDAEKQTAINGIFSAYDTPDQAGMSVAVYRHGALAYARGFGLASMEHGAPNTPDTIFRIGSTSKQFTAACVVLLSLTEELALEDDIRTFLPEMPDYGAPITILNLLNHTSGLRDYLLLARMMGRSIDGMSIEECVAAVARQEGLSFAPGQTYSYSNSNYLLIGEIVKRVSGQSLAEFAKENIFGPLGMESTHFHDRHGQVVRGRAMGYSPNENGELELDISKNDCVGDGGVFTTVRDMLRWDSNFYDEKLAGGLPFNAVMQTKGLLNDGSSINYGCGLGLAKYGGLPLVMHAGEWVGYVAEIIRFPEQETTIICLANRTDVSPTRLCVKVARVVLEEQLGTNPKLETRREHPAALEPPVDVEDTGLSMSEAPLADYAGTYRSAELDKNWSISESAGSLWMHRPWGPPLQLDRSGTDQFTQKRFQLQFVRSQDGIDGLRLWMQNMGSFMLKRQ